MSRPTSAGQATVLMAPIHQNSLEAMIILLQSMRGRGGLRPVLLLDRKLLNHARGLGIHDEYLLEIPDWSERGLPGAGDRGYRVLSRVCNAIIGLARRANSSRLTSRPLFEFIEMVGKLSGQYLQYQEVLDRLAPTAVVLASDRLPRVSLPLLKACRRKACRTLLLPFALSNCKDGVPPNRRGDERFSLLAESQRLTKRFIARWLPDQVYYADEGPYLFYNPTMTLVLALLGMLPARPWCEGGGRSDVVALGGEFDRRRYAAAGVDPGKLFITGDPNYDFLYDGAKKAAQIRTRLCERYSLKEGRKTVVCAIPQLGEQNILSWDRHWEEMKYLAQVLALSECNVLLSLHPKSERRRYQWMTDEYKLPLLDEPLRDVLPASDIFIATFSSTVRWAVLLKIPAVIIDFYGLEYSFYDYLQGSIIVRDKQEFALILNRLLGDNDLYHAMASKQAESARDLALFDGQASGHIIDVLIHGDATLND